MKTCNLSQGSVYVIGMDLCRYHIVVKLVVYKIYIYIRMVIGYFAQCIGKTYGVESVIKCLCTYINSAYKHNRQ